MYTLLHHPITILSIYHVFYSKEERVREFLCFSSVLNNVLEDLIHRHNRYTKINCKALRKLLLESIRRGKEYNLWLLGPSSNEATVLIQKALLEACLQVA